MGYAIKCTLLVHQQRLVELGNVQPHTKICCYLFIAVLAVSPTLGLLVIYKKKKRKKKKKEMVKVLACPLICPCAYHSMFALASPEPRCGMHICRCWFYIVFTRSVPVIKAKAACQQWAGYLWLSCTYKDVKYMGILNCTLKLG